MPALQCLMGSVVPQQLEGRSLEIPALAYAAIQTKQSSVVYRYPLFVQINILYLGVSCLGIFVIKKLNWKVTFYHTFLVMWNEFSIRNNTMGHIYKAVYLTFTVDESIRGVCVCVGGVVTCYWWLFDIGDIHCFINMARAFLNFEPPAAHQKSRTLEY